MKRKKVKKLTEFEKKWGEVCDMCGIRKGSFLASSSAEGGKNSVCKCDSSK